MRHDIRAGLALALAASSIYGASAQTTASGWAWQATLYGWLPGIHSSSQTFDATGGSIWTSVDPGGYLSNVNFVLMGALEARDGPWSVLGDVIYLNMGEVETGVRTISGPGGNLGLPVDANARTRIKGFVGSLAAGYSIASSDANRTDALLGVRHASLKAGLDWAFSGPAGAIPASGNAEASKHFTDAIVGLRGRASIGDDWFVPYYVDVGRGSSRFTWQALAGIGYRYDWGDVTLVYRNLSYDFKSDTPMSDLRLTGPQIGVNFRF